MKPYPFSSLNHLTVPLWRSVEAANWSTVFSKVVSTLMFMSLSGDGRKTHSNLTEVVSFSMTRLRTSFLPADSNPEASSMVISGCLGWPSAPLYSISIARETRTALFAQSRVRPPLACVRCKILCVYVPDQQA
jgi:hypothetical protein